MVYYTDYSLDLSDNSKMNKVVEVLQELEVIGYTLDDSLETYEAVKWYSHKKDMQTLASKFPEVLFTLQGKGEDSGDIWKWYFQGDKDHYVKAKFVYEDDPHGFNVEII